MGSSTEHSAYGPTHNPWDLDRIPGGSGGGSAAAVAAFEAPLAIGTDTGGSIRQPAAVTGTVGVKPTYGGVSRYGLVALASASTRPGPCARTVLDAALLHEVIAGHDPLRLDRRSTRRCPTSSTAARSRPTSPGCGSASSRELGGEGYQPGVEQRFDEAVDAAGRRSAPRSSRCRCPHFDVRAGGVLPDPAERGSQQPGQVRRHALRPAGRRRRRPRQRRAGHGARPASAGFGDEVKRRIILGTYALSSGYYDAYYGQAQKVRTLIARDFDAAVRAGRRAGLADRRRPRRSRSARSSTTRWRCTSTTSAPSRPTWPAYPAMSLPVRPGRRGRAAGRAPGDGAGAGRRPAVPGRRRAGGAAARSAGAARCSTAAPRARTVRA